MSYSTITDKYTECIDCNDGILKPTIAGRCKAYHYKNYRAKKTLEKQKEKSKFRSLIQSPGNKKVLEEKGIIKDNSLDLFYRLRREEMKGKCSEPGCYATTNKMSDKYFKWSICHIVPKSTIPSVSTNQFNWIELCWQHHSEMDASFEKQSKMKCFHEIKRRFELFKENIPNDEMRRVSPYLKNEIIYPI